MSTTIHTGHQITAVISPRADDGSPASIDGVPQWTSEQGLVELSPAPDGLSCLIRNRSAVGTDTVTVEADADLGEGQRYGLSARGLALEVPGVVPKLSDTPGRLRSLAPALGEHNAAVLDALDRPPAESSKT